MNQPKNLQNNSGPSTNLAGRTGSCVLLKGSNTQMLVPRNLVAEVIRHHFVVLREDDETGLCSFVWRGCRVPHVRNTLLGELAAGDNIEDARMVVFYGLKNTRVLPFYGFSVSHRPRLLQAGEEDLEEIRDAALHPGELMRVAVNGTEAFVPRVDYFEDSILKLIH